MTKDEDDLAAEPMTGTVNRCEDDEACTFAVDGNNVPCACGHLSGLHISGHPHPCDHTKNGAWTCEETCEAFQAAAPSQKVTARCGDLCLAAEVCRRCGNCRPLRCCTCPVSSTGDADAGL
jgi:hypothetical protein